MPRDDTQWRVLKVEWHARAKSVVAWYYSVQDAALVGYGFSTMKVRFESNHIDLPTTAYADVNGIHAWAKNANFSGAEALVADLNVIVYISYLRNLSPNFQFKQLLYNIGKRLPIFFLS